LSFSRRLKCEICLKNSIKFWRSVFLLGLRYQILICIHQLSETNSKTRPFFGGIGINQDILVVDLDDDNHVSSPNSTVSSISGKRSERDPHGENEVEAERTSCSCESIEEDGNGGDGARKKLRLSREQSLVLEETFKEHNTLNPMSGNFGHSIIDKYMLSLIVRSM